MHKDLQRATQKLRWKWNEIKIFFLVDLTNLYVKIRTFWLVHCEMDGHKQFYRKSKTKSARIFFENMQYDRKLLKPPYKYTKKIILLAAHIKQQLLLLQIWKNIYIFYSIVGGWYQETNVKIFFVFDYIELLFFNDLFQHNYFKKHLFEKTKLK